MIKKIELRIKQLREDRAKMFELNSKYKENEDFKKLSFVCEGEALQMGEEIYFLKELLKMIKGE